jgi:hypothetical protein
VVLAGIRAVTIILGMTRQVEDVRDGGEAVVGLVGRLMGNVHMRRVGQPGAAKLGVSALRRSHLRQSSEGLVQRCGLNDSLVGKVLSIRRYNAQAWGGFSPSRHAGRPSSEAVVRTISPVTQLRLPLFTLDEVSLLLAHLLALVQYLPLSLVFWDEAGRQTMVRQVRNAQPALSSCQGTTACRWCVSGC